MKNIFPKFAVATVGVALTYAIVSAKPAEAATFNFQYSFPGYGSTPTPVSASGTLTTTDLNPTNNAYTITGITGTRVFQGVTQQIAGLLPPAPSSAPGNDNLLFASEPFLDSGGFSYTVDGGTSVNVYHNVGLGYKEDSGNIGASSNFSVTPVPEPSFNAIEALATLGPGSFLFKKRVLNQKQ